jgi:Zn-dependent protease
MTGVEHATAAAPSPSGRRTGIPLGRLLGFPLHLSWSVLLLAALVTLLYGQLGGYLVGFGFVVLLLGSVLLHELGHAVAARRLGIGVRGITLEILGGYTEMERDAPNPRVELLVALAGPAVSLALGLTAAGAAFLLPADTTAYQVAFLVALANIIVAFFNVLPGLPLDGGRALRAAVWAASGSQLRGTLVAARSGQGVGVLTAVAAVVLYGTGVFREFGLVFLLIVAFTLWQGAVTSVRMARVQARVPLIDIDQLARPIVTVPSGTPLGEAQRRVAAAGDTHAALAVTDSTGRLVALVNDRAAEAVPQARRPWVAVDAVARDVASVRSVPAGLRGPQALAFLQSEPAGEYLIRSGDQVVGVLRATDVARVLRSRRPRREAP